MAPSEGDGELGDQKLPFKCCKSKVTSVLVCINCGNLYHRSCLQRKIDFKKDDPRIKCCNKQPKVPSIEVNTEDNLEVEEEPKGACTDHVRMDRSETENFYLKKLLCESEEKNKILQRNIQLLYENKTLLEEKVNQLKEEINNQGMTKSSHSEVPTNSRPFSHIVKEQIRENKAKQSEIRDNKSKQTSESEQSKEAENRGRIVEQNNRRNYKKTIGTATADGEFGGRAPKVWLYVYRVKSEVTEDVILRYLADKTGEESSEFVVKDLKARDGGYKCFMVAADFKYKDTFYDPGFWPRGVGYKRFNFRQHEGYAGIQQRPDSFLKE